LTIENKKSRPNDRDFNILGGLVKKNYFLLILLAAGEEPEITTDKTHFNKRNKLKEGL
jgi:hypothetical protein